MEKKLIRVMCVCLAVLLLWGCTPDAPVPTEPSLQNASTGPTDPSVTEPSATESTEATQPSETQPPETEPTAITEPPLDAEPPVLDAVTYIKNAKWKTFPDLLSMGGGILIASRNHFDPDRGRYINTLERVDLYNDVVLVTLNSDSTRELVCQQFADGCILSADPAANKFYVYDENLNPLDSFAAPSVDGYFSHDRQNYYYLTDGVLYRMDVATGNRGRVRLEHDLRFESLVGLHPTEDLVVARVYLSEYTFNCGTAVVDLTTGKLRLLSDKLAMVWLTGDYFYGVAMNDEFFGYDLYYGALSTGEVKFVSAEQLGGDAYAYNLLPGSHLILRRKAPDVGQRNTTIFDMRTGTWVDLDNYSYVDATFGATFLYEEQLIFGFYEDGAWFKPILIDTRSLSFDEALTVEDVEWDLVEQDVLDAYRLSADGPALSDTYTDLRAQADKMEETYGITIQFATQVEDACQYAGYDALVVEDTEKIWVALTILDKALAMYPAGMLEQFQTRAGDGGLHFCLTGEISGKLPTVGFAKLIRNRYVLGLDITADGLEKTIHHELWHAIEMMISTDVFDNADWAACNPVDFQYYGKYDTGYQDLTRWTMAAGSGAESYFVDAYSRINGREDRARIWETVMAGDAAEMVKAPALKLKLTYMVTALEKTFDSATWLRTPWGQYL